MVAERTEPKMFVFSRQGRWAWAYEEDSMRLASNDDFDSAEEALDAATIAYPDVRDVEVLGLAPVDETGAADRRQWLEAGFLLLLLSVLLYFVLRRRRRVSGDG